MGIRRKTITTTQKQKVLGLLREGLPPKEVAKTVGLDVSSVYKIRHNAAVTTPQWRRQRHEDRLMASLRDLDGIAPFPIRDRDVQTWLARPEERRWPVPKGYVSQDEHGVLSVHLSAEDQPEWDCLRQHLKGRPLWRLLEEWPAACANDLTHRRSLYRELAHRAEAATSLPVLAEPMARGDGRGLDHYYVFTVYDQVYSRLLDQPLAAKRQEEFVLDGSRVNLGGRLIVSAPTTAKAKNAIAFVMDAQHSLAAIPQATAAVEAYRRAVKATDDLKHELGKVRVMGGLPAGTRCDSCP